MTILDAGRATLELVRRAPRGAHRPSSRSGGGSRDIRVAFEVPDAARPPTGSSRAGRALIAAPVETPWRSLNSRLEAPAGLQLTLFQDLEPEV